MFEWDCAFPFDIAYRKEFNIPIFSQQHLQGSILISMSWYLEKMFIESICNNEIDKADDETVDKAYEKLKAKYDINT